MSTEPDPPLLPHTWNSRVVKGINVAPRGGHSMINYHNKIYLFGGAKKDGDINEVYEVDLDAINDGTLIAKLLPISTFPNLYEFSSVLFGNKLWIFGGADKDDSKNDIYTFDMESLENQCEKVKAVNAADTPVPRTQYGNKCLIEIDGSNNLVIFGGGCKEDKAVDDRNLYLFNLGNDTWSKVETVGVPPTARQGHVMVTIGQKLFLHGGLGSEKFYDDTYSIDLSPKSQRRWVQVDCLAKPCPRAAHNVVAISNEFFIFGGFNSSGEALDDLWKFDTKTLSWVQVQYSGKVSPRMDFAMCTIALDNKINILIHGGFDSDSVFHDDFVEFSPIKGP